LRGIDIYFRRYLKMAPPVNGDSTSQSVSGVTGTNSTPGSGVKGVSKDGRGVEGWSTNNYGVTGDSTKFPGVRGTSNSGRGVEGWSTSSEGVFGISTNGNAIFGEANGAGIGVLGTSKTGDGVVGSGRRGVVGTSDTFQGVYGFSKVNAGVVGEAAKFVGVYGVSHDSNNAGVMGINDHGGWGVTGRSTTNTGVSGESTSGIGVHGKSGNLAGFFEGKVKVVGDLNLQGNIHVAQGGDIFLDGADCAEQFDVANSDAVTPGTVLVIGTEGALEESTRPYDRRVAGIVSGAGKFRPGIILDGKVQDASRRAIALVGKVYCKVDASSAPIEVGDLLTTSTTPGHAMKAQDPSQAFGALIGKALAALPDGQGLIPVLVALQ
jgi:hypothetical protein